MVMRFSAEPRRRHEFGIGTDGILFGTAKPWRSSEQLCPAGCGHDRPSTRETGSNAVTLLECESMASEFIWPRASAVGYDSNRAWLIWQRASAVGYDSNRAWLIWHDWNRAWLI